jgi:hypothetical protein
MKFAIVSILDQIYLTPYIKATHNRFLNGNLELMIGWLKWEFIIAI